MKGEKRKEALAGVNNQSIPVKGKGMEMVVI